MTRPSELPKASRSLRILLVTEPSGGGSGRHVVDLARGLIERGHDVSVVYSPRRADPGFVREIEVLPLQALEQVSMRRSVGPWDFRAALKLRAIIGRSRPLDVIHAHSSKAGALARLVAPRGVARIYTPHAFRTMDPTTGALARVVFGWVERLLGEFLSDAIIAVAAEEAEHARSLGIPDSKIHIVLNGLGPAPEVDRDSARTALGLSQDVIAVGFVGRLCDQKDPVRFAEAVGLAHRRDPRIVGVVLGDGELKAETSAVGGQALRIFSGLNAREYMPAFDIFTMTSRYEAMPYVLLEALQASLPILSTRVGGTSVAVRSGENGAVLPVDARPEDIADALVVLSDARSRNKMRKRSAALASAIDVDEMVQATERVYRASARGGEVR